MQSYSVGSMNDRKLITESIEIIARHGIEKCLCCAGWIEVIRRIAQRHKALPFEIIWNIIRRLW